MFAYKLKQLRLSRGLTQEEFAKAIHTSAVAISRYENGSREPSISTLKAIADFYKVDFNYLLGSSGNQHLQDDTDIMIIQKFHSLDDRGKISVLNVLEHEFQTAKN